MYEIKAFSITTTGERIPVQLQIHATVGACDEHGDPVRTALDPVTMTLDVPSPRGHAPDHLALLGMLEALGWRVTPESRPTTRVAPGAASASCVACRTDLAAALGSARAPWPELLALVELRSKQLERAIAQLLDAR